MNRISFSAVCSLLMLSFSLSCARINHNINLTISESEQYVTIVAHYHEDRQYEVDKCMDKHFGRPGNMSFANARINGNIAMNNGTKFYIKKQPGFIDIRFNKIENSASAYKHLKDFGNDLKSAMQ